MYFRISRLRIGPSISLILLGVFCQQISAEPVDFAHQILPLLKSQCAKCHTNGTYKGGFSLDDRQAMLESGTVELGKAKESELIERLIAEDPELRMPKGGKLEQQQIAVIAKWIDEGAAWQDGFSFKPKSYRAPLELQQIELPPVIGGRSNPIDRIVDAHFANLGVSRSKRSADPVFLRRIYLDFVGELPDVATYEQFVGSKDDSKRDQVVERLLKDTVGYADHWITFWNDLLRNDYVGTGYIDGGRKQITSWLYASLLNNKPYDQFVRELISPAPESEGFVKGIKWRGRVNASQITQLQFAQNVSQVMLGINLKCASCHDSFINDWKLADAYSMAAIISDEPLAIHRCDVPTGETATAGFLFPQIGQVDPEASRQERLQQLSQLMTSPKNGRLARTVVNRIWDRMLGRGIVFPVDIMDNRPWSEELLEFLAADLVEHNYDLKRTLRLIATSETYQAETVAFDADVPESDYQFTGPITKRITAEQFQDAVWTLTNSGPRKAAKGIGNRGERKVRASLVPSNLLTRSLGRPNREQVVTTRPAQLTTLQALDLTNGDVLATQLDQAAKAQVDSLHGLSHAEIIDSVYGRALLRKPSDLERRAAMQLLGEGEKLTPEGLADLWWAVLMLPEFQTIR